MTLMHVAAKPTPNPSLKRSANEMLEPDVGKLASPVLRGRGGGNIALLPGHRRSKPNGGSQQKVNGEI